MGEVDGDLQDNRTLRHDLLVVGGPDRVGRRATRSGNRLAIKGDGFAGCPTSGGVGSVAVSDGLHTGIMVCVGEGWIPRPHVDVFAWCDRLGSRLTPRVDVDGRSDLPNNDEPRNGFPVFGGCTDDNLFGLIGVVRASRLSHRGGVLGVDHTQSA